MTAEHRTIERLLSRLHDVVVDDWLLNERDRRLMMESASIIERLVAALESAPCPRPANNRPDDFTVAQCTGENECGCTYGVALCREAPRG